MDVHLYSFTKRENATTQPSGDGTKVTGVVMKEPCSIMEPVIHFHMNAGEDPVGFNYMYIPLYERFYWVRDWVAEPGYIWTAYCKEDVLATWAVAIGNSSQYILRASNASDGSIVDELYPMTGSFQTIVEAATSHPYDAVNGESSNARFVLGVINNAAVGSMGSVSYYVLTSSGLSSFMGQLMNTTPSGDYSGAGLTADIYKSLYNPIQYVVSCIFCPIKPGESYNVTSMRVGTNLYISGLSGVSALSPGTVRASTGSLSIPKHPQRSARGSYLDQAPYSRYFLSFPPFGWIPIDPSMISGYSNLYYWIQMDPITGQALLRLSTDSGRYNIIYEQSHQLGVPVQLAQTSRNIVGAAISALGAGAGVAASVAAGNIPGAIMSGLSGLGNAAGQMLPQVQTQGSNGAISELSLAPTLVGRFGLVVDADNTDLGRPYCKRAKISDLGGYLLVANPNIAIHEATQAEMQEIKKYMAGGFFYV